MDTCNLGPVQTDTLLTAISQHCPNMIYLELQWIIINGLSLELLVNKCHKYGLHYIIITCHVWTCTHNNVNNKLIL